MATDPGTVLVKDSEFDATVLVDGSGLVRVEPDVDPCPCVLQALDCNGDPVPYWCQNVPEFDTSKYWRIDGTCLSFSRSLICPTGTEVTATPDEGPFDTCEECITPPPCPTHDELPLYDDDIHVFIASAICGISEFITLVSNGGEGWGGNGTIVIAVGLVCSGGYWTLTINTAFCTITMKKANDGHGPTGGTYIVTDGIGSDFPACTCTDITAEVDL